MKFAKIRSRDISPELDRESSDFSFQFLQYERNQKIVASTSMGTLQPGTGKS